MKNDRARYLIIGNSTAAVGAVEGIRETDPKTPIVLLSREDRHTYSRPLISYLLAGDIQEERMYYRPRGFYEANNVEALLGLEAVGVDMDKRAVRLADGMSISFETLLIAGGGSPIVPDIAGVDTPGVFTFTSWADADAIDACLKEKRVKRAVVIGGGLIGIKAAEALHARGVELLIVELADRLLPQALDQQASLMAEKAVRDAGVEIELGTSVSYIHTDGGRVCGARLRTGRLIPCEMIVLAVGVRPDISLVEGTSVRTAQGILINERCATSENGIFAAGDVAQHKDTLSGRSRPIPIFPNAYRQGRVAGINMAGGEALIDVSFSMNSVEVFGLPTISVGLATADGGNHEVLAALDEEAGTYRRIVLRNDRVVGALFVGAIDRAGIVTQVIRDRVPVSGFKDLLLTDQFGLLSLPSEYRKHIVKGEGMVI